MADVTSICNQALGAVGTRTTISSIAEASNEARQCLLKYEPTRKQLLRSAHWGFARMYAELNVLRARGGTPEAGDRPPVVGHHWDKEHDPPPPWLYAYALPSRYLAIRYLLPLPPPNGISPPIFGTNSLAMYPEHFMGSGVKFEIAAMETTAGDGKVPIICLLTNQRLALACFTADISDTTMFDESFTMAFVQGLAANICYALTGDLKLFDALVKTANSMILEARLRSANESLNAIDIVPDWFRVRGVGPAVGTGPWIAEYGPLFGGVY